MLKKILAIGGKPGLYKLITKGNRTVIVESLDGSGRRMAAFETDKIVSLANVSVYTNDGDMPLGEVFNKVLEQEGHHTAAIDPQKANGGELSAFMAKVLPDYDVKRVRISDIRKLVQWYNILVGNGMTDFTDTDTSEPS